MRVALVSEHASPLAAVGRVVLVPVLPGRSTTGLISRARPDQHVEPLAQEAS